ncbi:MAG: GNAT family N-acetyltransferase [Clostridia bacterium]|nr:GNAT family N-acetyltransferase [Clostridia bacterium]
MIVREFKQKDKSLFLELCREFYDSSATVGNFREDIAKMTFDRVMDHHENLWGFMLVDADTDKAVGYSLITSYWCNEEGGNVLVLDELYIAPDNRKKGYASIFMEWVQEYYRDEAVAITLEVLTTNQAACSLYKKEGFQPDGFITYTKKIK